MVDALIATTAAPRQVPQTRNVGGDTRITEAR
jgi:hypothetical protein